MNITIIDLQSIYNGMIMSLYDIYSKLLIAYCIQKRLHVRIHILYRYFGNINLLYQKSRRVIYISANYLIRIPLIA